jgi:hypothetical protein
MTSSKPYIAGLGILIALILAFMAGYYVSGKRDAVVFERVGMEQVANSVAAIYLLERNDQEHVRKVLLGMGSSGLDLAIEHDSSANPGSEYQATRCKTLLRLRDLREKYQFLRGPADANTASQPETMRAESQRRKYLGSLRCNT